MSKTTAELYEERLKRFKDAVALKIPDRVPVAPMFEAFPLHYAGVTIEQAMNDYAMAERALDAFYADFAPDLAWDPILLYPARVLNALDLHWLRWPGHGVEPDTMYQFIEGEYMKSNEYDEFVYDPSHFMLTKWLPRSFGALEGLSNIGPFRDAMWLGWFNSFYPFSLPQVKDSLKALMEAADELAVWYAFIAKYDQKLIGMGFPLAYGSLSFAPFDIVGDTLRGTRGIMTDIYRQSEKLLQAIEKMIPVAVEMGVNGCRATGNPFVVIPLHKGVDEFLSDEQYKIFYWSSLRKMLLGLIEAGLTPVVYGEGSMNTRLEHLRDVPRGKILYHFENVDMSRAKEALSGIACISGNVPNSLLYSGTTEDVKDCCKKLIDTCGKDGGFIMDTAAAVDDAKPENIKTLIEFTKEYGVYR